MNNDKSKVPNIFVKDGKAFTNSLDIAEKFSKKHKNVLQTIDNLECSQSFRRLNFQPSSYQNAQGKEQPMFEMTKNGFIFLVMGFTGQLAAKIKEAYIMAFDRMEKELQKQWLAAKLQSSKVRLSDWSAIVEMMKKADDENTFSKILQKMGFSKNGPVPEMYLQIPPSRLIPLVNLAKSRNEWAGNLIRLSQGIDVPIALPSSSP